MILVTGGAGFIGANFVLHWLARADEPLLVFDKLTYAANPESLGGALRDPRLTLLRADICDAAAVADVLQRTQPRAIVHFAAESHVDRSISGPGEFVRTNIEGTYVLLQEARQYWVNLDEAGRRAFRFLHVSTDEVYGSLGDRDARFTEVTPFAPNSPYAASKAASDHLVRAWFHTYGLPCITTHCSNNYGPLQFPEKLIPLMVLRAIDGEPLPVYGDGQNVRDWLYVEDHCSALQRVLDAGAPGATYNIGGNNEIRNIDVVHTICSILDELRPRADGGRHESLIRFVADRPGHDRRYAIDPTKMERELDWRPAQSFDTGILRTVAWYLDNPEWIAHVRDGRYREWIESNYGDRSVSRSAAA